MIYLDTLQTSGEHFDCMTRGTRGIFFTREIDRLENQCIHWEWFKLRRVTLAIASLSCGLFAIYSSYSFYGLGVIGATLFVSGQSYAAKVERARKKAISQHRKIVEGVRDFIYERTKMKIRTFLSVGDDYCNGKLTDQKASCKLRDWRNHHRALTSSIKRLYERVTNHLRLSDKYPYLDVMRMACEWYLIDDRDLIRKIQECKTTSQFPFPSTRDVTVLIYEELHALG